MHGSLDATPDDNDAPRSGRWDALRRLWLLLAGRRSAGFVYSWLGLVTVYVVLLSVLGWRGGYSLAQVLLIIAILLMGSPQPGIAAIATGVMYGAMGYGFGLQIWFGVVSGVGLGVLHWLAKASLQDLRAAAAAAANERWSQARRCYLLSLVALVALGVLWGGSIYVHLLAQGDPPPFLNWVLVGAGLTMVFFAWRDVRRNLTRNF